MTICAAEPKVEKAVCVFLRQPWVLFQVETRAQLARLVELLAADAQNVSAVVNVLYKVTQDYIE